MVPLRTTLTPLAELAARAVGFVWQLTGAKGAAAAGELTGDPRLLMDLSCWHTHTDLWSFIHSVPYIEASRHCRKWTTRIPDAHLALWWVPEGHRPSPKEAFDRLTLLRLIGPTPEAFTLKQMFPPPAANRESRRVVPPDRDRAVLREPSVELEAGHHRLQAQPTGAWWPHAS